MDVTVECKSARDKPWVLFDEGAGLSHRPDPSLVDWSAGEEDMLTKTVRNGMPYGFGWPGGHPFSNHPSNHIAAAHADKVNGQRRCPTSPERGLGQSGNDEIHVQAGIETTSEFGYAVTLLPWVTGDERAVWRHNGCAAQSQAS